MLHLIPGISVGRPSGRHVGLKADLQPEEARVPLKAKSHTSLLSFYLRGKATAV
jgi:hypothetical protein